LSVFGWGKLLAALELVDAPGAINQLRLVSIVGQEKSNSKAHSHALQKERANIERLHTILPIVHPTIGGSATR
jgi:hypothetical protein